MKGTGLTGATCSTFAKTQKPIQFSKLNPLDWNKRKQASSSHLGVISPKARRLAGWLVAPSQVSSPKGTLTHSTAVAPLTPADPLSIHYYQLSIHYYFQPSNIHLYEECEQLLVILSVSISKTCDQLWERLCKLWCCLVVDSDQDFKRWISLRWGEQRKVFWPPFSTLKITTFQNIACSVRMSSREFRRKNQRLLPINFCWPANLVNLCKWFDLFKSIKFLHTVWRNSHWPTRIWFVYNFLATRSSLNKTLPTIRMKTAGMYAIHCKVLLYLLGCFTAIYIYRK